MTTPMGDILAGGVLALLPVAALVALAECLRWARRVEGRPRILATWLAHVLIPVVLVAGGLAAGEVYYRFLYDASDSNATSRAGRRWFQRHWKLNASGFRDTVDYVLRPPPGKRRLTFLGDSFAAGHGIADPEDRFANRLRGRGMWDAHLLAKTGYDTGEHLDLIRALIAQGYELDEVVLVYVLNDISDIAPERRGVEARIYAEPSGFWARHSLLFNTLYYRWRERFDPEYGRYYDYLVTTYEGPAWEEQKRRLVLLRELVESHGGHLLVVTFPFVHALGAGNPFLPAYERLDEFWREQGVPHLNLLNVFEAASNRVLTVNPHDAPPSVAAHALAARAMEPFLRNQVRPASPVAPRATNNPALPPVFTTKEHAALAASLFQQGRPAEAIARWRQALEIRPDCVEVLNNLAWVLATASDPALRNGAEAVALAERACALAGADEALFQDTLTAAYAEGGRFEEAIATQQKAVAAAEQAGDTSAIASRRRHLERYLARQPWRE